MTDKGIGFNRTILLSWLEAAAESRLQNESISTMRERLEAVVSRDLEGIDARRKTIDVLVNIWHKSSSIDKDLHTRALSFFPNIALNEHIWLHYGLTLLYFPFFRQTSAVIGQFARTGEPITRQAVKGRLASEIGHLGSLNRSAERVIASLVDWDVLSHVSKTHLYNPMLQSLSTPINDLQTWLLTCALIVHPSTEIPFADLLHLPELFPFKFTITIDHLRSNPRLTIQRQGTWEMVRVS